MIRSGSNLDILLACVVFRSRDSSVLLRSNNLKESGYGSGFDFLDIITARESGRLPEGIGSASWK